MQEREQLETITRELEREFIGIVAAGSEVVCARVGFEEVSAALKGGDGAPPGAGRPSGSRATAWENCPGFEFAAMCP